MDGYLLYGTLNAWSNIITHHQKPSLFNSFMQFAAVCNMHIAVIKL